MCATPGHVSKDIVDTFTEWQLQIVSQLQDYEPWALILENRYNLQQFQKEENLEHSSTLTLAWQRWSLEIG